MRILHVLHQYLPEHVGGSELYTQWLSRAHAAQGHRVSVFHRRDTEGRGLAHRREQGVDIWSAGRGRLGHVRRLASNFHEPELCRDFERVLDSARPDVVHVQHLMGLPLELPRLIRGRGIPYAVTLLDFWWVCVNAQALTRGGRQVCDGPSLGFLNCARCGLARDPRVLPLLPALAGVLALRNRRLRGVLSSAGRLIAPTGFVRRWYAARGVPADRIDVIPLALETTPRIEGADRTADGPLRFAYIGALSEQKGVHVILEAFAGLRGEAELWIGGDERFEPEYVARLKALAGPHVRFLGALSRERVWEIMAKVDVMLVPSVWYETFCLSVSEAFVAGLPVLASDLGALADRVRHETDGLLLPVGDVPAWREAMQALVDNPEAVERLGAEVRPPVTLERVAEQVERVYNAIR